nr:unnamed protein product [Spirometra erinaceieuropaei]
MTGEDTQESMENFAYDSADFSLTISTENTVVRHQPAANSDFSERRIDAGGTSLTALDRFTRPSSKISRGIEMDSGLANKISKADQALVGWSAPSGAIKTSSSTQN